MADPFFEAHFATDVSHIISDEVMENLFYNCQKLVAVVQKVGYEMKFVESMIRYEQPVYPLECPFPFMDFQNIYDLLNKYDLHFFSEFLPIFANCQRTERPSNEL